MSDQGPPGGGNAGQARIPRIPQDRYALLGLLGSGGMGTVLKARHVQLNKLVAIKVLNLELLGNQSSLSRFETEARAGGQLSHPNLVAVFDFGYTIDGEPFFVMEYIEGASLSNLVKRCGKCSNADFIFIFGQALKALNFIHRNNIIHRDIKGSNIMLQFIEGDRYVKLLDFGIAKVLAASGIAMQEVTATGEAIGSPLYMSPEQCRGKHVDARADIYSLGCVMYECFAGYPPFRGANAMQTINMHQNDPPPALSAICRSDQDLQLASLIHKCILKNPDDRFQTAAELAHHLEEIANAGARVQALARPAPGPQVNAANRWKKDKSTGQVTPPAAAGGAQTEPGGLAGVYGGDHTRTSPLSQSFRKTTGAHIPILASMTGGVPPQQDHTGMVAPGQPAAASTPPANPEAIADLWHFHNVAGQQTMNSGSQLEAYGHFTKAVELAEQLGHNDERLPQTLNRLANCLKLQRRYDEAEKALMRSLQVQESIFGPTSRQLLSVLEHHANLLRIMQRDAEAEKVDKRMQAIMRG